MDNLAEITAFVRAAETLSFVAAGQATGVSASAVGKQIARLEATLGVRLFQRSTRRVNLTEAGQMYYERCRRVLDELADARAMLSQVSQTPRGKLRIGLPVTAYLAKHGTPQTPNDLETHTCIRFRFPTSGKLQPWAFVADVSREPKLHTGLTCNNMEALLSATTHGLGISYMPDFLARDALAAGELQVFLGDYLENPGQFWMLWPSSRHLSPKLRVFVDFMCDRML